MEPDVGVRVAVRVDVRVGVSVPVGDFVLVGVSVFTGVFTGRVTRHTLSPVGLMLTNCRLPFELTLRWVKLSSYRRMLKGSVTATVQSSQAEPGTRVLSAGSLIGPVDRSIA